MVGAVNSFDLFNTLVTSRHGINAGEVPVEDHIPIAENIARVQPDDVIVSDYYDAAKAHRILSEVCGLSNCLIVTEDGKETGKIWNDVKPDLHLGDNVQSDFDMPRRHGVRTELTVLWSPNHHEKMCGDLGWVMREARLSTWHADEAIRGLQLYQADRNFPFLFKVAEILNDKMKAEGFTRLLLCSRDGWLLYQLMSHLYRGYEIEYFFTSRLTRYRPSESYAAYAKERLSGKTLVVDMNGSGNSLKYLTDMFGGSPMLVVSDRQVVPSLVIGGLRETGNLAPHPMISDVTKDENGKWQPQYINPTGQDWKKPLIVEPQKALMIAVACVRFRNAVMTPYTLAQVLPHMNDASLGPLWADHLADSKAAYDLLNSGPLPHPVIL